MSDDTKQNRKRRKPQPDLPQAAVANSRARVCPGIDSSVIDRVAWCRHLMSSWEWYGTQTRRDLSAAWGVSESAIKQYSSEASRSLKLSDEELATERAAHASNAERIMLDAYSRCNNITGLPDYSSALKANEQAAAFKGLELKSKVELTGKGGGPVKVETAGAYDDILSALTRLATPATSPQVETGPEVDAVVEAEDGQAK